MKVYTFDCKSNNAPAYSCNHPNDNSGNYYKSCDIDQLKIELLRAEEIGKPIDFVFKDYGI